MKKRLLLLSTLFCINSFRQASAEIETGVFQTGVFPRGGAVKSYTDVLHFEKENKQRVAENALPSSSGLNEVYGRSRRSRRDNHSLHPYGHVSTMSPLPLRRPFTRSEYHEVAIIDQGNINEVNLYDNIEASQTQQTEPNNSNESNNQNTVTSSQASKTNSRSPPYVLMRSLRSRSPQPPDEEKTSETAAKIQEPEPEGNPLIYRYWNRSRARSSRSDSIPFLILGPRVDHWKIVGRILASRGFNVMTCERSKEQQKNTSWQKALEAQSASELNDRSEATDEGEALVSAVLEVLKWQKVVLVGCDKEAILAIEAALRLAPDRIAGLVFCGDLSTLDEYVKRRIAELQEGCPDDVDNADLDEMDIDEFLHSYVDCPCSIIWDGDISTWSESSTQEEEEASVSLSRDVDRGRNVIIGGGLAPHRRLPEQFAWTLTRFVENRVSTFSQASQEETNDMEYDYSESDEGEVFTKRDTTASDDIGHAVAKFNRYRQHIVWRDILPGRITRACDEIFAPGSLLVTGRIIATAVIYLSITRVGLFQYQNFRGFRGMPGTNLIPTNWRSMLTIPGVIIRSIRDKGGRSRSEKIDSSISELFPNQVDENENLPTEELTQEDQREESPTPDPPQEKLEDSSPYGEEPSPNSSENDSEAERELDSRLFHKFHFLDQIVS